MIFFRNRGMGICISLMFGRLGCVAGAIISALLIENHCEVVFYSCGFSLIGTYLFIDNNFVIVHELKITFLFLCSQLSQF